MDTSFDPPSVPDDPIPPSSAADEKQPSPPLDTSIDAKMSSAIGTNNSAQTNIANVLNLNHYFDDPGDTKTFSAEMAAALTEKSAEEIEALVILDEAWTSRVLQQLEERRVVLLTGDRGSGKSSVAKCLAIRMRRMKKASREPLIVGPLERRIRILPRKTADEKAAFGDRVTVFADIFEKRNNDLITFFTADHAAWDQLTAMLQQSNAYWIFTTANLDLEPIRGRLAQCVPCHEPPAPTPDALDAGIERKLRWHATRIESHSERVAMIAENRARLIQELRTIPRIYAFIDDFLRQEIDLDRALERFDKASVWFARELPSDVDAWCFALTLTLTRATPSSEPVSWSDFEHLRRAIAERIKNDAEMFPRRRAPAGDSANDDVFGQTSGASLTDDSLLERCQAVIRKDAYGLSDVVDFKIHARANELWETLLHHNRRILSAVAPVLRKLAESEQESISLRILAAQILGRIGAIDPAAISLPLIRREWVESRAGVILSALVGRVVQGVLASGIEKYTKAALRALEDLASADPNELDNSSRDRLVTAIAAYSQLGDHPEVAAMEHLGEIAIEHCAPSILAIHQFLILAEKADRDRAASSSSRRVERLRARGRGLSHRANQLFARQQPILAALEEALVYLAVMNDAVEALSAMRDWIAKGGSPAGMLATFVFLREGGIADRLEDFSVDVVADQGVARIGPLVLSAASGRGSANALCSFLADVHGSINSTFSLPADVQRSFRERFDECLITWAKGAMPAPLFREVVEGLYASLAGVRAGAMRRDIFQLLDSPAFHADQAMSSFAAAVRKRIG